jgi:hypothetical protein
MWQQVMEYFPEVEEVVVDHWLEGGYTEEMIS